AIELAELGSAEDQTAAKKNIVRVVKKVAKKLGNTPAVCRGSYIHPAILTSYQNGVTLDEFRPRKSRNIKRFENHIEPEEKALLKFFNNGSG
ncbi:MAG: DNA topoisomerase IB, partial [Pyrinomonadaceae bacterium]